MPCARRDAPTGVISMRFLTKKQVKEMVTLSYAHTARLEKAGLFPKRIRISQVRVAYDEEAIIAWMQQRMDQRSS
jgi:prophage regulatory protein